MSADKSSKRPSPILDVANICRRAAESEIQGRRMVGIEADGTRVYGLMVAFAMAAVPAGMTDEEAIECLRSVMQFTRRAVDRAPTPARIDMRLLRALLGALPDDLQPLLVNLVHAEDASAEAALRAALGGNETPWRQKEWLDAGTMQREAVLRLIDWARANLMPCCDDGGGAS